MKMYVPYYRNAYCILYTVSKGGPRPGRPALPCPNFQLQLQLHDYKIIHELTIPVYEMCQSVNKSDEN